MSESAWPGVKLFAAAARASVVGVERFVVIDRAGQVLLDREIDDDATDDEPSDFMDSLLGIKLDTDDELVVVVADLASAASKWVVAWTGDDGPRVAMLTGHPDRSGPPMTAADVAWAACTTPHTFIEIPADVWDEVVELGERQQQLLIDIDAGARRAVALMKPPTRSVRSTRDGVAGRHLSRQPLQARKA